MQQGGSPTFHDSEPRRGAVWPVWARWDCRPPRLDCGPRAHFDQQSDWLRVPTYEERGEGWGRKKATDFA
eukprot:10950567-Alexandrium_andersonii.AAC.1